jgi:hypothetical protein
MLELLSGLKKPAHSADADEGNHDDDREDFDAQSDPLD